MFSSAQLSNRPNGHSSLVPPSSLPSSPPALPPPSAPSSDPSDAFPSSPTSTSFYSSRPTPSSSRRTHKSRDSRRQSLQLLSSPVAGPSGGSTLRQQLLLSRPQRTARVVPESENPFAPGLYEHGGMRDGVWEENTEEEERILLRRIERESRAQRERAEDSWIEDFGGAAYEEEPEEELEPPPEFVYDPSHDTQQPYATFSALLPQMPSLASSIKSSPRSAYATLEEDDADQTMMDDEDSQDPSQLPPSSPPPLPIHYEAYEKGDLDEKIPAEGMSVSAEVAQARQAQFGQALLQTECPACKAAAPTINGSQEAGAKCVQCGWGMAIGVVEELGRAFGLHGALEFHRPVFMWTQFTGTLVLCSACEVEFAA